MKTKHILFIFLAVALTSCTAMYKSGQTPDDVYYSPARSVGEGSSENNDYVQSQPSGNYYSSEDRAIRMGISDYRWRSLDNDYYGSGFGYSPYSFSLNVGLGNGYFNNYGYYGGLYSTNYFNPYHSNLYYGDYYYNPYYNAYPVYLLPATPLRNSTPRTTNLNGYGSNYNYTNGIYPLTPHRTYNNSNTNRTSSGLGSILNRVLVPSTNNANFNTSPNYSTTRTYTPPASHTSSSSGSFSSGSSGGGRVSRH